MREDGAELRLVRRACSRLHLDQIRPHGLIAVLCCIGFHSRMGIAALALAMTLVQGFDGLIGALAHDPAKTYGPFVFALANFAALVWLLRSGESSNA